MSELRKGTFTLDSSPRFEGYTRGEEWNGHACPCFTKEQADRVVEFLRTPEQGYTVEYRADRDTYHITHPDDDCAELFIQGEDDTGVHVYWIGIWEWCWDEVGVKMTIGEILTKFQEEGLKVSDENGGEIVSLYSVDRDLWYRQGCVDSIVEAPNSWDASLDGLEPVAMVMLDGSAFGISQQYIRPCFVVWDRNPKAFEVYKAMVQ